ncbi:MAG TPA: HemK2/MTQ2 family protein methyltransferase [Chloroflexota bacterium]
MRDSLARRTGLTARLARRWFRWRFRLLQARRYRRPDLAHVEGLALQIPPGVFHPEFFFATALFLRVLARRPMAPGSRALDMGTGSGALAIALAKRGAGVTAIDINPLAVRCAAENAIAHGVAGRVAICQGDLFAPVAGERFDLLTFNPPFYARAPRDMADRAWAAGEGCAVLWRFLEDAREHLLPGGEVLIGASTEAPFTRKLATAPGWRVSILGRRELVSERLFVFSLRPE